MIDAPLAAAFTAGMVATVNPCGFAMLPATGNQQRHQMLQALASHLLQTAHYTTIAQGKQASRYIIYVLKPYLPQQLRHFLLI